jgi:SAM-dependent methyltransferase
MDKIILTQEQIDKYSPDNIDCKDFWTNCLSDDRSICGSGVPDQNPEFINQQNGLLLKGCGFYSVFPVYFKSYPPAKIVDIGAGFECARQLLNGTYIYYPCDITKRTPYTIEIDGKTLPFENESINYVMSSNVFQHLSIKQRQNYVEESHRILKSGGILFVATNIYDLWMRFDNYLCVDENNRPYAKVLDQYTPITSFSEVIEWSKVGFTFQSITQSCNAVAGIFLIKT